MIVITVNELIMTHNKMPEMLLLMASKMEQWVILNDQVMALKPLQELWNRAGYDASSGKESACRCRRRHRHGFDPWVRKTPWGRAQQPTPVFLPGESHGQRSLAGYSPRGHKESGTTEHMWHKGWSLSRGLVEGGVSHGGVQEGQFLVERRADT